MSLSRGVGLQYTIVISSADRRYQGFTFPLRTEGPAVHITTRADFYAATQHLPDPYYYPWLHGGGMPPGVFDGHRVRISDLVRLPLSSFRPPRF